MKNNIILEKSFSFAVRITKLCLLIQKEHHEFVLSRQLLKSGTSIGANIEEANGGESNKDFLSKISIAYKEARETYYWLRLLNETELVKNKILLNDLQNDCNEIIKILSKIRITMKSKQKNA